MKTVKTLLFFGWLFLAVAWADAGRFSMVNGEVFVERGAQRVSASVGMTIAVGDRIATGENARAQLLFVDETVITLGRNTKFAVEEYLFDEQAGKAKTSLSTLEGGFRAVTGKIGKIAPDQFQMKTKTATIGIRGTKFVGRVGDEGDQVACTDGAINVKANFDGTVIEVPAGKMVKLPFDAPPPPPFEYNPDDLADLEGDAGGTETEGNGENGSSEGENGTEEQAQEGDEPAGDEPAADEPAGDEGGSQAPAAEGGDEGTPEGSGDSLVADLEEAFMEGGAESFEASANEGAFTLDSIADDVDSASDAVNEQLASNQGIQSPDVAVAFAAYNPAFASVSTGTANANLPPVVPPLDDNAYLLRQRIHNDTAAVTAISGMTGYVVGSGTTEVAYHRLEGADWGYWQDTTVSVSEDRLKTQVWVAGLQTPSSEIVQMMTNRVKHTYDGQAIGAVHHIPGFSEGSTDAILLNGNNQVRINIDFGAANPVSGYIRFDTELGARWNANLAAGGSLSSTGYNHNAPTGSVSSIYGGSSTITGGSVQGQFYGSGATATGGTFNLESNQGTATGVFSGKR